MAKTLRTSGDYTIQAGDGYNAGSGANTITLNSLNVSVSGNLTVGGTSTTVSTTNTIIEDNIIELNTGLSQSLNDSGIIIERGSTGDNAAIVWDESGDTFKLGTTTATGADKSGGITVTAGALEVAAFTATTGTFSGAVTMSGGITTGSIITNSITSNGSNADISIQPSGTGDVILSALRVNGTTLDSSDSSKITLAEAVDITGAVTITSGTITGITDLAVADGGTGASSLTDNAVLTGTGTSAITAESNLSFNGSRLSVSGELSASVGISSSFFIGDGRFLTNVPGSGGGGGSGGGIFTELAANTAFTTSSIAIGGSTAPDHGIALSGAMSASLNVSASGVVGGRLHISGAVVYHHKTSAATITASVDDYYIGMDSSGGAVELRLPDAAVLTDGHTYIIKDEGGEASTNNITVLASGSQTIYGENSLVLESSYASFSLYCNGINKYYVY